MQKREKILLGCLLGAMLIWWGRPVLLGAFIAPLEQAALSVKQLRDELDLKEQQEMQVLRATGRMTAYRQHSLPADPITAQRAYTVWLTDLLDASLWSYYEVLPGKITRFHDLGSAVQVRIDGQANSQQLAMFLAATEHSGLLQRLERLTLQGDSVEPDSNLSITLVMEAISLQTSSQQSLNDLAKMQKMPAVWQKFAVESPFTKKRLFLVSRPQLVIPASVRVYRGDRLQQKVDWTGFQRGDLPVRLELQDPIPAGLTLDNRSNSLIWQTTSETEAREYPVTVRATSSGETTHELSRTVTVRVQIPNAPPQMDPIKPQILYPEEAWTLQANATDPDQPPQPLTYSLSGSVPSGLQIDSRSGLIRWIPTAAQAGQTFNVQVVATDRGEPPLQASTSLSLAVQRDYERSTELMGCIQIDGQWVAWFRESQQNQRFVLKPGDPLQVGRYQAKVLTIEQDQVQLQTSTAVDLVRLGESIANRSRLKTLTPAVTPSPAAAPPNGGIPPLPELTQPTPSTEAPAASSPASDLPATDPPAADASETEASSQEAPEASTPNIPDSDTAPPDTSDLQPVNP